MGDHLRRELDPRKLSELGQRSSPAGDALQGLRPAERAILASLAGDRPSIYAKATLDRLGLDKSRAQRAILELERRGYLRSVGRGRWSFIDPFLAEWIRGAFESVG